MKKLSKFLLSKWYMDCVSDEGDVFIGYAASLRWRSLVLNYSSTLQNHNNETRVNTTLQKVFAPKITGLSLHWSSDRLNVNGIWKAIAMPIERTIFKSETGSIEWRCLQPHARAEIYTGEGRCLQGLGYAERILMSIPPWRLPIEELRWGRFLSNSDALVWIDWRGSSPLTLVFYNGVQIEDALVTDSEVICNGGKTVLAFEETQILREGPIIKTALSAIPGIRKILPVRSLEIYECKWRGQGVLKEQQRIISHGWTIHEVVRFG